MCKHYKKHNNQVFIFVFRDSDNIASLHREILAITIAWKQVSVLEYLQHVQNET